VLLPHPPRSSLKCREGNSIEDRLHPYIGRGGVFRNAQTGNIVLVGVYAGLGNGASGTY